MTTTTQPVGGPDHASPPPTCGTPVPPDGMTLAAELAEVDALIGRVDALLAAYVRALPPEDDGGAPETVTSIRLTTALGYLKDSREDLDGALRSWTAEVRHPPRLRACRYCGHLPAR